MSTRPSIKPRRTPIGVAIICPLVVALGGCGTADDDGKRVEAKEEIVGGSNTTIQQHPWQVSLQTLDGFHFCGGSILTDTWILTAAHCVDGASPNRLRVRAGITRQSQNAGQTRSVAEIFVFPGYIEPPQGHDAALLRLSTPLSLDATASPIDIVTPADAAAGLTAPGVNATVTGWGTLSSGGDSPDILQAVSVPIVSNAAADAAYTTIDITDDQIGAGIIGVGGVDSCQGDSGGPLTVSDGAGGNLLAGIVSWGFGCADARWPGMYGRVSSFAAWIQSHVPLNEPPSVTITSPANGATVSGVVTVSADVSDPDGSVVRVRFSFPDGTTQTDTEAPFTASWDSASVADGTVTLRAEAFDDSGNSTVAFVNVVTSNGNDCGAVNVASMDTPISIPDNNATGIASNLNVSASGAVVSLSLSLNITHTWRGDLVVDLISPSGTSVNVHERDGGSADNLVITDLDLTTAFGGERASGSWSLRVQDLASQDVGTLQGWSLQVEPSCSEPPGGDWSASGTPNLDLVDNGEACTSLTVSDAGDAADVLLDIVGSHSWRAILRGSLTHNGVTQEAFSTGTFPREAGSFAFSGQPISGFSGSAVGEWTLCIIDTDEFGDSGVLNSWSVHN